MFSPRSGGWALPGLSSGGFWLPALLANLDEIIDLFQTRLRQVAAQPDNVDHPMQVVCHTSGKIRILHQHVRNSLHCAIFVEQQHEELLAEQLFELLEREALSGLFAQAPQKIETALINHAVRRAHVDQCAQQRLLRPTFGDIVSQFTDPSGDQSAVCSMLTWPLAPLRIGGSEA